MRLINTISVEQGMVLAQPIHNEHGIVLLQKNMSLTNAMIRRLVNLGITYVYIMDEMTDDVVMDSGISADLKRNATTSIKESFLEIKNKGFMENAYILNKDSNILNGIVHQIMKEIQGQEQSISLLSDIFLTDDYVYRHSLNVTIYSLIIGTELKLGLKELSTLGIGAILHDVGKIFIDPKILRKPSRLSDAEFQIMKSHTTLGYNFLKKQSGVPSIAAHCAYQHHERLDGSGYPRGLEKNDIHSYAQIIAIADVFDAVTSNRVYRNAMLPHEGLEILYAGAVGLFDIGMVEAFKKGIAVYPSGLSVELSDGRAGFVVKQNKHLCDRPIIRVVKDRTKQNVHPYDIDLSTEINVTIIKCNIL